MDVSIIALAIVGSVAPAPADKPLAAIEEIIVTATRRETALRDTALSITALSSADLQQIGARDIADFFEHIAGLDYTEDTFAGHRISSRGIAAGTFVETRPLGAFYLDETPMMALASGSAVSPQWGGARPQAVDIARVEVLRGPQGTLFGASSMGGTVRMITHAPDPADTYGSLEMSYSATDHGGANNLLSGVFNAAIIEDRFAVRLVAYRRDDDGYIDNIARGIDDINGVEVTGGRLSALWNVTPTLSLTARAQRQERDSGGLAAADIAADRYEQIRPAPERDDETWELFTLEANQELPWGQLKVMTSRLEREPVLAIDITDVVNDIFGVFSPTANAIHDQIDDTVHEVRLTSAAGERLSWVAGAFYQRQERAWIQQWQSPGFDNLTGGLAAAFGYPDALLHLRTAGELRQRAIYGELSYRLRPKWEATIGARAFEFDYAIDNLVDGLLSGGTVTVRASNSETGVTPKLGLAYRPRKDLMFFANAAEGYRPGGTNEFTDGTAERCRSTLEPLGIPVPPERGFESDSLWNFEVGTKAHWPERRLDISATAYHVRWDDMQTTRTVTCFENGVFVDVINIIENVGKATTDGFELEVNWGATEVLDLGIGVSFADARLGEDAPNLSGEAGEAIPTVPKWTLNASATARFAFGAEVDGYARAAYSFVDSSWSEYDDSLRRRTPSRHVLDLRLGAQLDNWQVSLFADNVFDERSVLLHSSNVVGEWQALARPRTIGVNVRWEY